MHLDLSSRGRNRPATAASADLMILIGLGCQGTATAYYPTPPSDGLLRAIGKGRDIRVINIFLRVVGADGGTVQAVAWPVVLHMLNPEGCTNRPCCQPSPGHLDRRVQLVGIWVQVQHVSVEDRPPICQHQVSLATAGPICRLLRVPHI